MIISGRRVFSRIQFRGTSRNSPTCVYACCSTFRCRGCMKIYIHAAKKCALATARSGRSGKLTIQTAGGFHLSSAEDSRFLIETSGGAKKGTTLSSSGNAQREREREKSTREEKGSYYAENTYKTLGDFTSASLRSENSSRAGEGRERGEREGENKRSARAIRSTGWI